MAKKKNDDRCFEIIRKHYDRESERGTGGRVKKLFGYWILNDQDRSAKDKAMEELWEAEKGDPTIWSQEQIDEVVKRMDFGARSVKSPKVSLSRMLTRFAAVAAPLAIIVGGWLWLSQRDAARPVFAADYSAPYGATLEEALGDSTTATINAGSRLTVVQTKKERVAELVGESYFNVTKDTARPFVVKTEELTVTVLGTEFNVEAYPDRDVTIVTLHSGKVAVKTLHDQSFTLEPNQQLTYYRSTNEGVIKDLDISESAVASDWTRGILVFNKTTVAEALKTIERHYNVEVKVENNARFDNVLTGNFAETTTLDEVMTIIKDIVPELSYTIEQEQLYISKE